MAKESLILRFPFLQWLLAHLFPRLRQWSVQEWPTADRNLGRGHCGGLAG